MPRDLPNTAAPIVQMYSPKSRKMTKAGTNQLDVIWSGIQRSQTLSAQANDQAQERCKNFRRIILRFFDLGAPDHRFSNRESLRTFAQKDEVSLMLRLSAARSNVSKALRGVSFVSARKLAKHKWRWIWRDAEGAVQ